MKLNFARLEKVRRPRGSRIIARRPVCAGMNSRASFSTLVRRQKPMLDAQLRVSAVVTHAARCGVSDGLETQARMASWRPWGRHDIITAGVPDFLPMVDAGRGNLTHADRVDELQLFTLSQQ